MSEAIKFLTGIDGAIRRARVITIAAVAGSVVFGLGCFYMADSRISEQTSQVYVLDNGSVLQASRMGNGVQLDLEIADHVRRYHELMFNISPDGDIIRDNLEKAVKLGGNCAVQLDNRRKEIDLYKQFIAVSAIQTIRITSTEVDMTKEPYNVKTTGVIKVYREQTETEYSFFSECEVSRLENRSIDNPHGLMITRFARIDQTQVSQRSIQGRTSSF